MPAAAFRGSCQAPLRPGSVGSGQKVGCLEMMRRGANQAMPGNAKCSPGECIPHPQATMGSIAYGRALLGPVLGLGGLWALLQAPALSPGWGPGQLARGWAHGLLCIVGHLLTPASLKRADLQTHTTGLWFRPGRSLVAVPPPGPDGSRGCALSPRDQQVLEGPGTSVWKTFWRSTGRPKRDRPGGERGASGPSWL